VAGWEDTHFFKKHPWWGFLWCYWGSSPKLFCFVRLPLFLSVFSST
jgi:hypothetical protein